MPIAYPHGKHIVCQYMEEYGELSANDLNSSNISVHSTMLAMSRKVAMIGKLREDEVESTYDLLSGGT